MKDEWEIEMGRMLDIIEHESEASLRKINDRFEALDRPFNEAFRQYVKKMSEHRLDMSFTKIEMERWNKSQAKSSKSNSKLQSEGDHQHYKTQPNVGPSISGKAIATNLRLSKDDDRRLNAVKNEDPIEIVDSDEEDDEDGDIKPKVPTSVQSGKITQMNINGSMSHDVDNNGEICVRRHVVQSNFDLEEVRIPLNRCDSDQRNNEILNDSVEVINLEDENVHGQNLSNQNVSHQIDGNGQPNIQQQLTLATISSESIILVESNSPNLSLNTAASTATLVMDGSQLSDQIIISVPPNQSPSASSNLEFNKNAEQKSHAQSIQMELSRIGSVKVVPRMEISRDLAQEEVADNFDTNENGNGRKQEIESDRNMSQQLQDVPEEMNISHHSTATTTSESATEFAPADENLELYRADHDTDSPHVNKHTNIESNHQKSMSEWQPPVLRRKRKTHMVNGNSKKNPKSVHAVNANKRHKCEYCEYSAEFKSDLTKHIRMHTGERPFDCKICEKCFSLKHHLDRHMKTHRNMFAFQCSNCRLRFSDEQLWKLHENRCEARGYECYLCKKIVYHKQDLVSHMRKHTGEKFRCSKCCKQFSHGQNLIRHMKSHGKLFRFQCSKCRQGFSQKMPWEMHQNCCKAKLYECYLCGKKCYQVKTNLLQHMRHMHTGEKPFSCSDCPKRFCHKSNLKRHAKGVHN